MFAGMPASLARQPEVIDTLLPDGRRIRAGRWGGRGAPLVLLHGLLASSEGWAEIAESSRRESVAFDLPGFGGSDLPARPRNRPPIAVRGASVLRRIGCGNYVANPR
jgi:pimeloyl-ACP methyl ester carboxylesterase